MRTQIRDEKDYVGRGFLEEIKTKTDVGTITSISSQGMKLDNNHEYAWNTLESHTIDNIKYGPMVKLVDTQSSVGNKNVEILGRAISRERPF